MNTVATLPEYKTSQGLLSLGGWAGWSFAVLGVAPFPKESIHLTRWTIVPAHLDTSPLPERSLERIQAIYAAGLRPKGFVVVHEKPLALPNSIPEVVEREFHEVTPYAMTVDVTAILEAGAQLVATVAKVAAMAVVAVAGVTLPAIFAVGSALLLDPILVAVTEDDVWVEIDRWVE